MFKLDRTLLNRGFVLRRKGLSTDTIGSLLIGLTSSIWLVADVWHIKCLARESLQESRDLKSIFGLWLKDRFSCR
jgi:hypothetical protein